jgi:hypothetical protein
MVAISRNAPLQARDTLREALAIIEEIGSNRLGQSALDVAAGLAAAVKDWARAGHLYGAVNAEMAATGLQREPADDAFLRPLMELARQALGDGAFAKATAGGEKAGYQEAIDESRRWLNNGS